MNEGEFLHNEYLASDKLTGNGPKGWTKEFPTEEGYYWYRFPEGKGWLESGFKDIMFFSPSPDYWCVDIMGSDEGAHEREFAKFDSEFYGPIEEPE